RQPLIRGVIGAGATVTGAVLRDQRVDGRYFVSSEFYKTLLQIRAGILGGHNGGPPALPGPRDTSRVTALREIPSQQMLLTSDNTPSTQASASPSLTERLGQVADRPSVRALRPLEDPAV